jgi:hypothetical protein
MIVLDTSALCWAVEPKSRDRSDFRSKMESIERLGGPFVIPTPALAEFLCRHEQPEDQAVRVKALSFVKPMPFDVGAALAAGKILNRPRVKGYHRQQFKVDCMIYAVAVNLRARWFLHCNDHFVGLAGKKPLVPLYDVRTMAVQQDLFSAGPREPKSITGDPDQSSGPN